jgi:hypothetical protein
MFRRSERQKVANNYRTTEVLPEIDTMCIDLYCDRL